VNTHETPSEQAPLEAIGVELLPASAPGYAAIVHFRGEHDVATANDIDQTMRGLGGNVLVDLTRCEFIDSTVIGVLLDDVRARNRDGNRLDLLVPPANTRVTRTLEIMGVGELLLVHEAPPPSP
jgi:anti-anti-sigma factor